MDAALVQAQQILDEAQRLMEARQYANAVPLLAEALTIQEGVLGPTHLDVATTLTSIALVQLALGNAASVEPWFQRALAIRKAALGPSHPDVANSLNNLGTLYFSRREYTRAEPLLQEALTIRDATLSPDHPGIVQSLNSLAALHDARGHYGQAEPFLERALTIQERTLGPSHPGVAEALNALGYIHQLQGHSEKAEPLLERALSIREAVLGPNHPDVATSLNNLANLHRLQGQYTRAEPLYQRALALLRTVFNENHPHIALALNNLAVIHQAQGLYAQAEPLYKQALEIQRALRGENHPDVALSHNNLAALYKEQGDYARAEKSFKQALAIRREVLGPSHPDVAESLTCLAMLYQDNGQYEQSEQFHEQALAIRRVALGLGHPDVAHSLSGLGYLCAQMGNPLRARSLLELALGIREVRLGENHPDVASSLHALASLYSEYGDYESARTRLERALAIHETVLGPKHPKVASTLSTLAQVHLGQDDLNGALALCERSFTTSEEHLRQEVFGYSETRLASLLQRHREEEECLYRLASAYPGDKRVRHLVLSVALLRKGRSLEETAGTSRIIYRHPEQVDREAFKRLCDLRTQLSTQSWEGPGKLSPKAYQQRLEELAAEGDALEAQLARRSAPLRAKYELPRPSKIVERVAAALPNNGALVEFIAYHALSPARPGSALPRTPHALHYLALILFANGSTLAHNLGPAKPIDDAAQKLRQELVKKSDFDPSLSQDLYKLAFGPLVELLGKAKRLFLSPDGPLSLIPFDALHDGSRFLIDAWDISYLTSGRDLLPRPTGIPLASTVVAFADPQFSTPPATSSGSEGADLTLKPLPGTRKEAEALQRLFPEAKLFIGADATKDALLHLPTPGLLHIGTHGFFEDSPAPEGTRAAKTTPSVGGKAPPPPDSPLLRSFLVLTCAPELWAQPEPPGRKDLNVTALELAGLDLWGTQLVVLSACQSGRGDVMLGQGVYGLRRSFMVAGAETLITSLWSIDDEASGELISTYYQHLLAGQGRAAALRQAMRELRQKRPEPYYWAPFIALGLDTPLQGLGQPQKNSA